MSPTPNRTVVTLSATVADKVAAMGEQMGGANTPEVVRRGLFLLGVMLDLPDNEELVIRNRDTNVIERIRFAWEMG